VPFTVSHVAAVLPLRRGPDSRWALPTAPLVLGSMAPDLVMVLGRPALREVSHSLPGVLTLDLPIVVVSWLLWVYLLREPVCQLVPGVAARWRRTSARGRLERLVRWVAAALVGIATHLAWDAFTHRDGWVVRHVDAMQSRVGPLLVADWLQLGCSALGLVVLAGWAAWWWRTTKPTRPVPRPRGLLPVGAALFVLAFLGAARRAAPIAPELLRDPLDRGAWRAFVTLGLFGAGGGAMVAALLTGVLWRLLSPHRTTAEV
jgi:Domain of unknown function (DUF4184)